MIKAALQGGIRRLHVALSSRPLPDKLALLFHDLPVPARPAFAALVGTLRERGYAVADLPRHLESTERSVHLSFDDNFEGWFESLEFLEETDVVCTFYVNSVPFRDRADPATIRSYFDRIDYHGPERPLSTGELRAIRAAGHRIGSHSFSHHDLGAMGRGAAQEEIRTSKEDLEDILGEEVTDFSFPYGMPRHFNRSLTDFCFALGFRTVATGTPGMFFAEPERGVFHRSVYRFDRRWAPTSRTSASTAERGWA